MGQTPPPLVVLIDEVEEKLARKMERRLRRRRSIFPWRRRQAERACDWLISYLERKTGIAPEPEPKNVIVAPPKPLDSRRAVRPRGGPTATLPMGDYDYRAPAYVRPVFLGSAGVASGLMSASAPWFPDATDYWMEEAMASRRREAKRARVAERDRRERMIAMSHDRLLVTVKCENCGYIQPNEVGPCPVCGTQLAVYHYVDEDPFHYDGTELEEDE